MIILQFSMIISSVAKSIECVYTKHKHIFDTFFCFFLLSSLYFVFLCLLFFSFCRCAFFTISRLMSKSNNNKHHAKQSKQNKDEIYYSTNIQLNGRLHSCVVDIPTLRSLQLCECVHVEVKKCCLHVPYCRQRVESIGLVLHMCGKNVVLSLFWF